MKQDMSMLIKRTTS